MPDVQEVFRMSTQKVRPDPGALERQHTRQRRRSVGKKTGAFAVAAVIVFGLVALIMGTRDGVVDPIPAIESPPPAPPTPPSPFLLDLRTGETIRLPETIVDVEIYVYVASPDGVRVAFSGPDHPLTITELDGNEARTIRLPEGSNGIGPAWSPDGGSLLYQLRSGENDIGELVVEDLSTGRRRELTHLERGNVWWWFLRPTFTADGRLCSTTSRGRRGRPPGSTCGRSRWRAAPRRSCCATPSSLSRSRTAA